jgi:N-acetylglucosaminyl-diphospho-decaprenol L-rhamnosyltransferase
LSTSGVVDVVVVAYGSQELIGRCLGSVADRSEVASIVVVDNGDGRSSDAAEALGATVLRRPDNPGFGASQNVGAFLGRAPFLLLLNPDAAMEDGALASGLLALEDPSIGAVQGVVSSSIGGEPERSAGRELGVVHLLGRAIAARRLLQNRLIARLASRLPQLRDHVERAPALAQDVESLAAVSMLVRRQAFGEVGGFDEAYFLYGEDLDLCRRLRRASWRLVALPTPWSTHLSGASADGWWSRELRWWEGTLQFAAQWWSAPAFLGAWVAGAVMLVRLVIERPQRGGEAFRALLVRSARLRTMRRGVSQGGPRH